MLLHFPALCFPVPLPHPSRPGIVPSWLHCSRSILGAAEDLSCCKLVREHPRSDLQDRASKTPMDHPGTVTRTDPAQWGWILHAAMGLHLSAVGSPMQLPFCLTTCSPTQLSPAIG